MLTEKAKRLIEGKNFGFLATLMPDGSPQVSPVWVDLEGALILVNTSKGRVKQRNVKKDQRVAIAIADQNNPYDKVLIRGRVVAQTIEAAEEHIDRLAKKYIDKDIYPWRQPGEERVIIKIEAISISN